MDNREQNKIRFNGAFSKLINPVTQKRYTHAKLIEAIPYHYEDLAPAFKAYDTAGSDYIILGEGECIILIFKTTHGIFTTLRELSRNKLRLYRSRVGEIFEIVINNPVKGEI